MPTSPAEPARRSNTAHDSAGYGSAGYDSAGYDVVVLGAGPAGLAASVAAARAGARTALMDSAARVGGQYWRHREGDSGAGHHHWPVLRGLRAAAQAPQDPKAAQAARLDLLAGHAVWHVEGGQDGFTVHATVGQETRVVRCRTLIVATGAYDRQLPFPGWTLPGVYTAGGAQALLKGHGVTVGRRVVIAGTGPFLLPVATGLARAGATVAGVFEAGSPAGFRRHLATIAGNPDKLVEGAGYLGTLLRHRIPYRTRMTVVAAHGTDHLSAVTVARLDADWRILPGTGQRLDCDAVAVGYGFTPQLDIPLQLGCATRLDADGSLVATVDDDQRASVPGVYLAGEVCGVGGAALALAEGELAGRHAACAAAGTRPDAPALARLRRRRSRLRAFAAALHDAYPVRPGWPTWLAEDTQVCRCEEVSAGDVRRAVADLGATDARTVKLLARPGMGLCQGRVCGYATACLVAQSRGDGGGRGPSAQDLRGLAARPVAQPVTLGQLARY